MSRRILSEVLGSMPPEVEFGLAEEMADGALLGLRRFRDDEEAVAWCEEMAGILDVGIAPAKIAAQDGSHGIYVVVVRRSEMGRVDWDALTEN